MKIFCRNCWILLTIWILASCAGFQNDRAAQKASNQLERTLCKNEKKISLPQPYGQIRDGLQARSYYWGQTQQHRQLLRFADSFWHQNFMMHRRQILSSYHLFHSLFYISSSQRNRALHLTAKACAYYIFALRRIII